MTDRKYVFDPKLARTIGRAAQLTGHHELRGAIDPNVLASYESGVQDVVKSTSPTRTSEEETLRVQLDDPRPSFVEHQTHTHRQHAEVGERMFDSLRRQRGD